MKRPVLAACLLTAGIGLTACGSTDPGPAEVTTTAKHDMGSMKMPADGPKSPGSHVAFVAPRVGEAEGHTVTATVHLKHFVIDPAAVGKSPRPGHGHLHFELDGGRFDRPRFSGPNGAIAAKLGVSGMYSPALAPRITYRHLPRGRHTLDVYLANNNHTRTGVQAETTFTVG
jgi:hypothetical protein